MPLTELQCRAAICAPEKQRERYADSGGLYLEVLPAGGKYWRLKFRFAGKEKRLAIGVYPGVSLAEARRARDAAKAKLQAGTDPLAARREAKHALVLSNERTFEAVARAWHEQWKADRSDSHVGYVLRRLESDVFPAIGAKPIESVTALNLVSVAKKIEARGAAELAKRSLQTAGQILRYAVAHGLIERNPAADVKPGDVLKGRKAVHYAKVDAKELPDLLRRMHVYHGNPWTRAALHLLALTAVRTTELIGARWQEFDLEAALWRIPAERMKVKDAEHIVPLSAQAVEWLQGLEAIRGVGDFVFPNERDHERAMSNNAVLAAIETMGYKHRMTGHGWRAVFSTWAHEAGHSHAVIELCLAHQQRSKVVASYNHAKHIAERRKLLQAWADHLDATRRGAKVLPIRAA